MTHQCPFCLKRFDFASKLKRHHLIHTGQKPFTCLICGKAFRQSAHLKKHMENHVSLKPTTVGASEPVYVQPLCSSSSESGSIFEKPTQINVTSEQTYQSGETVDLQQNIPEMLTNCEQKNMEGYSVSKQKLPQRHQCTLCLKNFTSPYKLQRHLLINTGQRPKCKTFKCKICGRTFRQLSHLKLHCLTHKNDQQIGGTEQKVPTDNHNIFENMLYAKQMPFDVESNNQLNEACQIVPSSARKSEKALVSMDKDFTPCEKPHVITLDCKYPLNCDAALLISEQITGSDIFKLDVPQNGCFDQISGPQENTAPLMQNIVKPEESQDGHDNKVTPFEGSATFNHNCPQAIHKHKKRSFKKNGYQCATCFKFFSAPSKLQRHILSHTGQRPFSCYICSKAFRQLAHLKFHLNTHFSQRLRKQRGIVLGKREQHGSFDGRQTSPTNFPVETSLSKEKPLDKKEKRMPHICGGSEKRSIDEKVHSMEVTQNQEQNTNITENLAESVTIKIVHECPICFKCFSAPSKLRRHCLIHTGQRPFQCYLCCHAFRQLTHLKAHYRVHTGSVKRRISITQRHRFHLQSQSQRHQASKRSPKKHVRHGFNRGLKHTSDFMVQQQNHVSSKTTDQNMKNTDYLQIEVNGQVTSTPGHIANEKDTNTRSKSMTFKNVHLSNGSRNSYCCPVCSKAFEAPSKLQRHILIHTGQRPFKCLLCPKAFRQRSHLNVHQVTHKLSETTAFSALNGGQWNRRSQRSDCSLSSSEEPETGTDYPVLHSGIRSDGMPEYVSSCNASKYTSEMQGDFSLPGQTMPDAAHDPLAIECFDDANPTRTNKAKGYQCIICEKVFDFPSKLSRHLLVHMDMKPFTCEICSKSFRQRCHLQSHMRVHRQKMGGGRHQLAGLRPEETTQTDEQCIPEEYSHSQGNMDLEKKSDLISPSPRSSPDAIQKPSNRDDAHPRMLTSDTDYDAQQNYLTLNDIAGESSFANPKEHMYTDSVETPNPPLPESPYSTVYSRIFSSDVDSTPLVTTRSRKDVMEEKTILSKQKPMPKKHRNLIHHKNLSPKDKPKQIKSTNNQCMVCLKYFSFPSKLSRHILIHTGIKPFKCSACPKSFTQFCHLQSHLRVHQLGTNDITTSGVLNQQITSTAVNGDIVSESKGSPDLAQEKHSVCQTSYIVAQDPNANSVHNSGHALKFEHQNQNDPFSDADLMVSPTNASGQLQNVSHDNIKAESHSVMWNKLNHSSSNHETNIFMHPEEKFIFTGHLYQHQVQLDPDPSSIEQNTENDLFLGINQVNSVFSQPVDKLGDSKTETRNCPTWTGQEHSYETEPVEHSVHQTEPPNDLPVCPVCCQCFTSQKRLSSHKCISEHRGEASKGPYQCAICFKSFQSPSKLKRHYIIHTGQRPFQCTCCSKTFTQSGHLKTHMLTHR